MFFLFIIFSVARADDGPLNPASFSFAINQAFIQNMVKAAIQATHDFQSEYADKDNLIPDFINMTAMLFEPEQI